MRWAIADLQKSGERERERERVSDREIDIQYTTSHFSNENDLGTNVLIKDQFSGHGKG